MNELLVGDKIKVVRNWGKCLAYMGRLKRSKGKKIKKSSYSELDLVWNERCGDKSERWIKPVFDEARKGIDIDIESTGALGSTFTR